MNLLAICDFNLCTTVLGSQNTYLKGSMIQHSSSQQIKVALYYLLLDELLNTATAAVTNHVYQGI